MEDLRAGLAKQAEKLSRFVPKGLVEVEVDGQFVIDLDLDRTNRVQFIVDDESAALIEVVAHRGERLVLAIHLVRDEVWESLARKCVYTVRHKNGAKITFVFRRIEKADKEKSRSQLFVTVTYSETAPERYLAFLWQRLRNRLSSWGPVKELSPEMQPAIIPDSRVARQLARSRPKTSAGLIARKMIAATLLIFISSVAYVAYRRLNVSGSHSNQVPMQADINGPDQMTSLTLTYEAESYPAYESTVGDVAQILRATNLRRSSLPSTRKKLAAIPTLPPTAYRYAGCKKP